MSTVTAEAEAPPPAKGKKKLIIIIAAVALVVLAGAGGTALLLMKKSSTDADAEVSGEDPAPVKAVTKLDPKLVPVFVPLEPFTVNLADRDAERYAQVGITLEIDDTKTGEQIKLFMPAIRNNILMAIADRSAVELLSREGKAKLADKVRRETSRALGYEVEAEPAVEVVEGVGKTAAGDSKKKAKKRPGTLLPVKAVHFSNFIIQ